MSDPIYFDNAATTFPKPPSVVEEIAGCMREYCGNPGRGSHSLAIAAAEKLYEAREFASKVFSAKSPENVVFTYNATHALNNAIKAYIPEGSHVLISDMEHNAVLRPIEELRRRGVITYDVFSTSGSTECVMRGIRSKIRDNTSAVVSTLASNICSRVLPSREIGRFCRSLGLIFIADGAQAAGHRRISMADENIDVLCLPGHKGLFGPQGIGMMITRMGDGGNTVVEGGSGTDSASPYMPEYLPDRFEAGTANTPGIAGLLAGMRFVCDTGIEQIESVERELWYRLYSRISGDRRFILYGDKRPSAVVLLNKRDRTSAELGEYLNKHGICTRSGLHCAPLAHESIGTKDVGGVRISFSVFNTLKEVDELCDVLYRA